MAEGAELPVWLGEADDASATIAAIDAWSSTGALIRLAISFGYDPRTGPGRDRLDRLDLFAARNWDFRQGRERNLARTAPITGAQADLVFAVRAELGLSGIDRPRRTRYDAIVMTGGMVRAGLVKPRFVAELLRDRSEATISVDDVVFLGAFRPFAGDEVPLARALGVDGSDEVDAMRVGIQRAFGPLGEPTVTGERGETAESSWQQWRWTTTSGLRLSVLAAPSSIPHERRANSADTYRFFASRHAAPFSVLQVTTPIYVPYQAAVAVEVLGIECGIAVETIGTNETASDLGEHSQVVTAANLLQELRGAIGAMRSLRARLSP